MTSKNFRQFLLPAACALSLAAGTRAQPLPDKDQRAGPPKTLDTLRSFPAIKSKAEWEARARDIREHIRADAFPPAGGKASPSSCLADAKQGIWKATYKRGNQ